MDSITPIICQNDAEILIHKMKEFLENEESIKDICLLEKNNEQVVFLLSDKSISEEKAKIWWSGYSEGLKAALE